MIHRQVRRALALVAVLAFVAAACGDSKASSGSGNASTSTTSLTPQVGGSLTYAVFSDINGFDPIVALGHGTSGGIQMAAVYDTLMRYNQKTRQYVNWMTDSVTPNADYTQWTIKLKPNIKFTDGTDYDADAVKYGLNRHRSGLPGAPACADYSSCPRNNTSSAVYMALVKDVQATDKLTLSVTLNEPWTSFQYALSAEAGMIPSPTAIKKANCDPTKQVRDCSYNLNPVGAGPFKIDSSFKPGDPIQLVRNTAYWGGQVYLDRLTFVNLNDGGGDKSWDALKTGTVQGAYLRTPQVVAQAHTANLSGISTIEQAAEFELLNAGVTVTCTSGAPAPLCTGKPDGPTPTTPVTKDLRIRQAIAAAIDMNVLNTRVYDGKGLVSSDLFQSSFPWDPKVPGPKYDPEAAKKLVAAAKADGWDGKVRLLFNDTQALKDEGLAIQSMLQVVGMNPDLQTPPGTTYQTVVTTTKDFDLSTWGGSIGPDDSAMWSLAQNLTSTSTSNRTGFKSAKADQAFKDLRVATTDAQKTAAYKVIAEEVNAQLPWVTKMAKETFSAFNAKVHGYDGGERAYTFFDKVWIEK